MSVELRRTRAGGESWWFWCPGCETHHRFVTKLGEGEEGPVWGFDGNAERPTFTPSLRVRLGDGAQCHLFLTKGVVRYLSDCTHGLAGQSIPVQDSRFRPA